jgi:ribosomal protein S18 acetylase RimI-like enzyme
MVQLVPIGENDYQWFIEWAIQDYAQAQVEAGTWHSEDALCLSRETFESLLPEGSGTPNHHLCAVVDEALDRPVGYLWYGERDREGSKCAVLYEFMILEEYRRQGYGTQALLALEEQVRRIGMRAIVLHVFGHNAPARALYKKVGYVERNITMTKQIG